MKSIRIHCCAMSLLLWLPLGTLLGRSTCAAAQSEETFAVLQTRTETYKNVTVTSKTKDWIFILHSRGMGNIKIEDLPLEVQVTLGYAVAPQAGETKSAAAPSRLSLPDFKLPSAGQLQQSWRERGPAMVMDLASDPGLLFIVGGILVLMYLCFCYCSMLICRKAHTVPGFLVWVPVLQLIPLLRAAGMPRIWLVAFLVPVVNLLAQLVWYVKIVEARGKRPLLVLWLVLPLTAPFAFLYLAFSGATPIKFENEKEGPLVLETA